MKVFQIPDERKGVILLIVIALIIQALALLSFGIKSSVDTQVFLDNADSLLSGDFPAGREFFYVSYALILALLRLVGLDPEFVILIQIATYLLSVFCLYKLILNISKDRGSAFFGALLYVCWFKFQQWNLILYTDAIFAHMVVISMYFLFTSKTALQCAGAVLLLFFTVFLRPVGLLWLISLAIYGVYRFRKTNIAPWIKITGTAAFVILLLWMVNAVLTLVIDSFISSYQVAEIIYPKISLGLDKPDDFRIPDPASPALVQLLLVFLYQPLYMLKISLLKGLLFVFHVKPYFSWIHNGFILAYLVPSYILAIRGLMRKKFEINMWIMLFIGMQILMVTLTSENWDGRFLLPVLPWVFMLSGIGIRTWSDSID